MIVENPENALYWLLAIVPILVIIVIIITILRIMRNNKLREDRNTPLDILRGEFINEKTESIEKDNE